jgi:hypothetical protein
MSDSITKTQSKQELIGLEDTVLNTVLEQLSEGKTLASIRKEGTLPISLISFYNILKKPENKEIKEKIENARRIGVNHIVDKLLDIYQADISSDTLDPNMISWVREKTKFIQWLASKTSELYADKKENVNNGTVNNITVSWLDSPELENKYQKLKEKQLEEKTKQANQVIDLPV